MCSCKSGSLITFSESQNKKKKISKWEGALEEKWLNQGGGGDKRMELGGKNVSYITMKLSKINLI